MSRLSLQKKGEFAPISLPRVKPKSQNISADCVGLHSLEIVLTAELFWLRRRCAGRFRVDLPAQGIAAEQGHITIEHCVCS